MKIERSSIVTAFAEMTIGTKVVNSSKFEEFLMEAIQKHDPSSRDKRISMPPEAFGTVSAGVGARSVNPDDYVLREYRGAVDAYLRRELASPVESLAVIAYTAEEYLADPDVRQDEVERIRKSGATHVLVAILASAGPKAPLSPKRLVHNLAGGNKETLQWNTEEIREKAVETKAYYDKWCVVAD